MRFILTIAAAAFSFNAAHAGPPSKTDVIQCGIDAGSRSENERRAFVEGCVTAKSAARESGGSATQMPAKQINCRKLAESAYNREHKSFVEGCTKAKKDWHENAKAATQGK